MAEVATSTATHAPHQHTGRFARIHQPPSNQRTSETNAHSDYFSTAPRKRQRAISDGKDWQAQSWPAVQDTPKHDEEDTGLLSTESLLASDRYRLQGGFDTPGLLASTDADRWCSTDADARKRLQDEDQNTQPTDPAFAGPLARERNGFARSRLSFTPDQSQVGPSPSWTRLALALPLSIAGKMFTFGGAVLKGFYAGGGQGYEIDEGVAHPPASLRRQQSPFEPGTPIPGAWHDSPPLSRKETGHNEVTDSSSARPPPNKRRLTDRDTWVMVGTPDLEIATPPSPRRRISSNNTPRLTRPSASRTASRRCVLASSRRHSHLTSNGSPGIPFTTNQLSSPTKQHSFGGRQSSPLHNTEPVPLSPDTEKLRRRQVKQERAADRTMSNMSKQLEELIRQGQEALGTKFVVEDDDDQEDEGFVDDEA